MNRRLKMFTLAEAEALIPELTRLVKHLMDKKALYDRRHDAVFMHELLTEAEGTGGENADVAPELERDFVSLEEDLMDLKRESEKIFELGCTLQDIDTGCVDLPGKLNETEVFFCWKHGQERIFYYREVDVPGRELIPVAGAKLKTP